MKLYKLAVPLAGLALGIPSAAFAAGSTSGTAAPAPAAPAVSSWSDEWQKMETDMDRIFHDTMQDLHLTGNTAQSQFGSSIDLREKPDAYEARVYVPKADAASVSITLKNGALDIATGDKTTGRYHESIQLPGPVQPDKMKVENKDGFVLVTIPKATTQVPAPAATEQSPAAAQPDEWDQGVVRDMQRMQQRMDQLTRDAFANVPNVAAFTNGQFLDSTVKLDDQKNQYVAHFYLPDDNIANVNVSVSDNDQLRLTATAKSNEKTTGANGAESQIAGSSSYQEEITLPGPVNAAKMKVDRQAGVVTVTLPKA